MSTVTNSKRVRHHVADEVVLTQPAASPRRWKWIAVLGVLVGFVWLLPGLVAHSPLINWAIRAGTGKLDGNVAIGSASLGWFSPVGLSRLEVRDTKGELVVQADEIKSEKSLWRLLANLSSLGKFRLEKPNLALVLRSDGSNLEDVLAKYLSANDSGQKSVGLELEVNEGTVSITDQQSHRTWQIEKLQVTASMAADPAEPLRLEGSATVADPNRPGSVQAKLNLKMPQSAVPATSAAVDAPAKPATPQLGLGNTAGDVNVQAEGVPLATFSP